MKRKNYFYKIFGIIVISLLFQMLFVNCTGLKSQKTIVNRGEGPSANPPPNLPLQPAPDWVKEIEKGKWVSIGRNTMFDLDPAKDPQVNPNYPNSPKWYAGGQQAVITAWNGGVYARSLGKYGSMILCGGGHADYYGNEVYAFDLETQLWHRLSNPYPETVFPIENGIWPNNTPSVPHTYDHVEFHPTTNSFVMMRTQYHNGGGFNSPVVAMFSLAELKFPTNNEERNSNNNRWRFSAPNTMKHHTSGGWSFYDPIRDTIWAEGGDGTDALTSFDPKPLNSGNLYGRFLNYDDQVHKTNAVGAYDPINKIALVSAFRDSDKSIYGIDLDKIESGETARYIISQTGNPPSERVQSHGWEWSIFRSAFLYYRSGSEVFEFKQDGEDWKTSSWRWQLISKPQTSGAPPVKVDNGIYGRFRVVSFKDAEIAVLVNDNKGPVYVFRIE